MATHTKGPWRAIAESGDGWSVRAVEGDNGFAYTPICEGIRQGHDDGQADARLIAAAPELLSLVKDYRRAVLFYAGADDRKGDYEAAALKRVTLVLIDDVLSQVEG